MEVSHDKETDVTYISLTENRGANMVAFTKKIKEWLFADYSEAGELLGLEVLDASRHEEPHAIVGNLSMYLSISS